MNFEMFHNFVPKECHSTLKWVQLRNYVMMSFPFCRESHQYVSHLYSMLRGVASHKKLARQAG